VVDDSDLNTDSDLRRRAAWLLVMLAIVAVLLVVVISALVGTGGGGGQGNAGPGPLDPYATSTGQHRSSSSPAPSSHSRHHKPGKKPGGGGASSSTSTSVAPVGHTDCPTQQTCILDGDIGNAVQAINDYRVQHGQPAKPGAVSLPAQTCAVHNGNGCSGGWAETELATPDGNEAVQKILQFGRLLDPAMKSFGVGWAYDPGAKLYYFAIIRND
jgi:hypothetical protein